MKILIIVQARTSSTRLPGKVNLKILGKSVLYHQIERMKNSKFNDIVVAITTESADDILVDECKSMGVQCFRGHPTDLLDRHYQAAKKYNANHVVKIPSDCPLIDPKIIDRVIEYYLDNITKYDFVSNLHPATYPDGNDVEIMPFSLLEKAWKEARKDHEREHTTPFIWDNPDEFRIGNVQWEKDLNYSMTHRFTIDYQEDFDFISKIFEELYPQRKIFSLEDILRLLDRKPEIYQLNAKYCGVNWYRDHLDKLKTIQNSQTKQL